MEYYEHLHGTLTLGLRKIARAIAMRWRWPPDSCVPCSPTDVLYLHKYGVYSSRLI